MRSKFGANGRRRALGRHAWWVGVLSLGCGTIIGTRDSHVQGACTTDAQCAPGYACVDGECSDGSASLNGGSSGTGGKGVGVAGKDSLGGGAAAGGSHFNGGGTSGASTAAAGDGFGTSGSGATSGSGVTGGSDFGGGASGGSAGSTSAGTGGAAQTGGSAGAGVSGSGGAGGVAMQGEMIDDMEDQSPQIAFIHGRNGYWFVGGDGTVGATMDPPSNKFSMTALPQGDRSDFAAHLKATGFTSWGSVIGFNLVESQGVVDAYDAGAYCGLRFWAKAGASLKVRFRLPDGDTHQSGGVCTDPGGAGTACYDHFGAFVQVTTAWQSFTVLFRDLAQLGIGYHPNDGKFKPDQLYSVEWALTTNSKTSELWIDDVEFVKCN